MASFEIPTLTEAVSCGNEITTRSSEVYLSSFVEISGEELASCSTSDYDVPTDKISVAGEKEEEESDIFIVDEALQHINFARVKNCVEEGSVHRVNVEGGEIESQKNLFQRLKRGNMFLSIKRKCTNIVAKGIAHGAQKMSKKHLKVPLNPMPVLPSELHGKHGACTLSLKLLKTLNNESLIQEKWLTETSQLLEEQILSIGVFGRHKAGKSAVLNALLHQEILPSAVKNETTTLLKIFHNSSKHVSNTTKHGPRETCPDCPTMDPCSKVEIWGRRKIRSTIRTENTSIRDRITSIDEHINGHKMVVCVPFMSSHSTGDIQVVLMDTPGLSEANELGITDIAEHQLMTCSAYIYVISCTQLEDQIDTETLKAIIERDPSVFQHRRMLIVVTRLDEYKERKTTNNDDTPIEPNSDDEEENISGLPQLIENIKKTVQAQFNSFIDIPDSCIIPVSATGSLESRKVASGEKSHDSDVLLLNFKKRIGRPITIQELDEFSQIPKLEKCLSDIIMNAYQIWTNSIVRDCSRYLEHAIVELASIEDYFKSIEREFVALRDEKLAIGKKYSWKKKDMRHRFESGSKFHFLVRSSYEEDVKSLYSLIDEKCIIEYDAFEAQIMKQKALTSQEYRKCTEDFIVKANKSLKSEFECLKFHKMNNVIKESYIKLGQDFNDIEHLMAAYCDIETIIEGSSSNEREENQSRHETHSVSTTLDESDVPVRNAPLELKTLLEHGRSLDYTVLDKVKILALKVFLRLTNEEDPRRILLRKNSVANIIPTLLHLIFHKQFNFDKERNALLEEVKKSLLDDSKQYFNEIKTNIIKSYLEEQTLLVEDHILSLELRYKKQTKAMNQKVKKWDEKADIFRKFSERQKEQTHFLTQHKINLNYLYTKAFD